MKCTPELLEKIKEAIESISYGSVAISIAERGNFVGIKTERLERIEKTEIFKKSEFKQG
jgi:hypothetical protein